MRGDGKEMRQEDRRMENMKNTREIKPIEVNDWDRKGVITTRDKGGVRNQKRVFK